MVEFSLLVGSSCLVLLGCLAFFGIARLAQGFLCRFGSQEVSDELRHWWTQTSSWCGGLALSLGFLGTIFGLVSALPRLNAGAGMDMGAMGEDFAFALSTTAVGLVIAAVTGTAEFLLENAPNQGHREAKP